MPPGYRAADRPTRPPGSRRPPGESACQSPQSSADGTNTTHRHRLLLWLLALAPVVCACSGRDLWAPDEPRYGQVGREMLASGDWLVPHVNGAPYAEKPPLYWWGVCVLSLAPGEVTARTARLGGALYAFGCVFLIAALTSRWFRDGRMGITAAALFSSTLLCAWNGSRAGLDLPLTFWILLAVERGEAFFRTGSAWRAMACGAACAAAILTKGPLGLLFPALALATVAVARGRAALPGWRRPGWWLLPLALVALGLAWLLPAVAAGGDAYSDRLLGQIRGRATGAEGHHLRPIWYYLERGSVWSLPWALPMLAGLIACVRVRRAPAEDRVGLAACLAIGVGGFVLLSLIATKREVYMLPLFPFTAAAAAYALHRGRTPRLLALGTGLAVTVAAFVALLLLAVPLVAEPLAAGPLANRGLRIPGPAVGAWAFLSYLPAAALFALAAWIGWRSRSAPARVVRRMAPVLLAGFVYLVLTFLPRLDTMKSYAPAAHAAENWARGGPIYNAGFGQGPNLLWSLDRATTQALWSLEDVAAALAAEPDGAAVVAASKWWDARKRGAPPTIREVWRDDNRHRGLVVLTGAP